MAEQLTLDFEDSYAPRQRRAKPTPPAEATAEQIELFTAWIPNVDIHLDNNLEAAATITGRDPERVHAWLNGLVGGNLTIRKPKSVTFPTKYLDRFLYVLPPAQVTLDAAATAVGRALWAHKLGLKPLRVYKEGRRLRASSSRRWPSRFAVNDIPWNAIHACVLLDLPLDIDDTAQAAFMKKLGNAGAKIATSTLAGSAISIETSRPALVENLNLPGLAYDGPARTGKYKLPILSAEPLLRQQVIDISPVVRKEIEKAVAPVKPLTGLPESFPWSLYDFQAADAGRGLRILQTTGGVLFAGDMGSGKSVQASSRVLTPKGPAYANQIRVGDWLVGKNGMPTRVLGVFPQGVRPLFIVKFTDGAFAVVDEEHLWAVQSAVMKKRNRGFKVLSTRELLSSPLRDAANNLRWYIPIADPIQFERDEELPVDPYVLGALLGDGSLLGSGLSFASADQFMVDELNRLFPDGADLRLAPITEADRERRAEERGVAPEDVRDCNYRLVGGGEVRRELMNLGVWGKRAWEKEVPTAYLYSTEEDRRSLLQGLLDTDGGVKNQKQLSSIEFTSTSEKLADNVVWLVQSLGGTARKNNPARKTYTYKGAKRRGRLAWRVSIAMPSNGRPFRLPRKADTYIDRVKYQPTRGIVSIEPYGDDEAVCFKVEAEDSLFLLDQAIVNHNTTVSLAVAEHLDLFPLLVLSPQSAFSTWVRQLGEMGRSGYLATKGQAKTWEHISEHDDDAVIMSLDRVGSFLELLETRGFKSVIVDEVQRIRSAGSRRSKSIRNLSHAIPYRIGLSGTPLTNTVHDVLPLGAFLVPGEWRPRASEKDLADMYPGDPTEALAEHLGSIMVRRRMDQVGRPLPKRNDHRIYVQMTPEQRRALAELEAEAEAAKEAGEFADPSQFMHAFARLQAMRKIVNSPGAAGVPGPNPKVSAAIDMAKEFLAKGRKGVIFCADRTTFRELGQRMDEENIGWVGIWGSTPPEARIENERMFHANDPAPNGNPTSVVLCTIQAGAESWSASPTGTWLISTAYVYAPSTLAQMEARVHRMNSDLNGPEIEIMYIHAQGSGGEKGSLDDRMVEILAVKQQLFAQVVDRRDHVDTTNVHLSMSDVMFLMTGERDEKRSAAEKDAKAAADREKAKKDHARKTLYAHKSGNAHLVRDDGSTTHTLEDLDRVSEDDGPSLQDLMDAADADEGDLDDAA